MKESIRYRCPAHPYADYDKPRDMINHLMLNRESYDQKSFELTKYRIGKE